MFVIDLDYQHYIRSSAANILFVEDFLFLFALAASSVAKLFNSKILCNHFNYYSIGNLVVCRRL